MPTMMRTATISLLPKPGKYQLDVDNFRPKYLRNNDYEVFLKVLALHLEVVITPLVHKDQIDNIIAASSYAKS